MFYGMFRMFDGIWKIIESLIESSHVKLHSLQVQGWPTSYEGFQQKYGNCIIGMSTVVL